jgi:hypothetical protein
MSAPVVDQKMMYVWISQNELPLSVLLDYVKVAKENNATHLSISLEGVIRQEFIIKL